MRGEGCGSRVQERARRAQKHISSRVHLPHALHEERIGVLLALRLEVGAPLRAALRARDLGAVAGLRCSGLGLRVKGMGA